MKEHYHFYRLTCDVCGRKSRSVLSYEALDRAGIAEVLLHKNGERWCRMQRKGVQVDVCEKCREAHQKRFFEEMRNGTGNL